MNTTTVLTMSSKRVDVVAMLKLLGKMCFLPFKFLADVCFVWFPKCMEEAWHLFGKVFVAMIFVVGMFFLLAYGILYC